MKLWSITLYANTPGIYVVVYVVRAPTEEQAKDIAKQNWAVEGHGTYSEVGAPVELKTRGKAGVVVAEEVIE